LWQAVSQNSKLVFPVIAALPGIQIAALDSRLRGNDVIQSAGVDDALAHMMTRHGL
jgi:hypothetical protein